jgi:hypothetical protein
MSDHWSWAAIVLALCRSRRAYPSADPKVIQDLPLESYQIHGLEDPGSLEDPLDQALARDLTPDPGDRSGDFGPLVAALKQAQKRTLAPAPPRPESQARRTSVRGRTTSRIVLPKAVQEQNRTRKVFSLIALFALCTSALLFWVLLQQAPSP